MQTEIKLPQFIGKPLIIIPDKIPQANFLEEEFGEAVNKEVQRKYRDFEAIRKVGYSNGVVRGSNPFYVVAVNEVIRPEGLRAATQADLERVLRANAFDLRGIYEDSALVLRTESSPNEYLARHLMKQVKARNPNQEMPVIIPLNFLELTEDSDSDYGLAFKLKEDAEIIYAPILNESDGIRFNSEDIDAQTGLPTKVGSGDRTLNTRNSALSGLSLGRDLDLFSDCGDLAYSGGIGRVVLVSTSEAGSQNFFNAKLTELQKLRDSEIGEINKRYSNAEKILRGEN